MAESSARILVVDDTPANLTAMVALLEQRGYPVVTAPSGEAALEALLDGEFAVVLLDVNMPRMDGFETARFIRSLDRTRALPIVFLTALDQQKGHLEQALTYGMTDFIYKPASAAAILSKISVYVDLFEKNQSLRLQAEQLRLQADAERSRFQATFDVAPLGIGYLTADGKWLGVNPRLRAMLGYATEELLARPLCELVSPADIPRCVDALERIMTGDRSVALELRLVHQGGHEVWVQLTGSAMRKDAAADYLIAMLEDITERKALESQRTLAHQRAEDQRRLLEAVLRQMPAGALVVEAETGRLVLANEQARTLLGKPLVASARESLLDPGGLAGPLVRVLARSLATSEVVTGEVVVLEAQPGDRRTLEVSTAPVLDAAGRPAAVVAILHDVTALEGAKRDLEEAAELRERFVGIVSHDLRNPLVAVQMSARLLEDMDLPESTAPSLARIRRGCGRMAALIVDLLDLTRARQAGGIPIREQRIDLASLCQQVADEVQAAHPNTRVEVHASPLVFDADPERLAQALTNLMANAVKFRSEGTSIRLSLRQTEQGAMIEVHNEGEAIAAELLPYVFDAYHRGEDDRARSSQGPGLGLGLYIAQQVVLAHGGSIEVTSRPESGTTFSIALPASASP